MHINVKVFLSLDPKSVLINHKYVDGTAIHPQVLYIYSIATALDARSITDYSIYNCMKVFFSK